MSITLTVADVRRTLRAVQALTEGMGREWCTTAEIAETLGAGTRETVARLGLSLIGPTTEGGAHGAQDVPPGRRADR